MRKSTIGSRTINVAQEATPCLICGTLMSGMSSNFVSYIENKINQLRATWNAPSLFATAQEFDNYIAREINERARKISGGNFNIQYDFSHNFLRAMREKRSRTNTRAMITGTLHTAALSAVAYCGYHVQSIVRSFANLYYYLSNDFLRIKTTPRPQTEPFGSRFYLILAAMFVSSCVGLSYYYSKKNLADLDVFAINQEQAYKDLDPVVETEIIGTCHLDYTALEPLLHNGVVVVDDAGVPLMKEIKGKRAHNNVALDKILAAYLAPLYNADTFEDDRTSIRLKAFRTIRELSPNINVRDEERIVDLAMQYIQIPRNHTSLTDRQMRKVQNLIN